jgi:hypothetical protein
LHHLVSTKTIPGVYNPPYATRPEDVPSAFNVPLETHLRIGVLRHIRTQGLHPRLDPGTQTAATLRAPGAQTATLVPAYTNAERTSLQATAPYDRPREAARTERRINQLRQLDTRPFNAGGRTAVIDAQPVVGVHAGAPYSEAWLAARTSRDLANSPESKSRRVTAAPFVTASTSGKLFEESERAHVGAATMLVAAVTARAAAADDESRSTGAARIPTGTLLVGGILGSTARAGRPVAGLAGSTVRVAGNNDRSSSADNSDGGARSAGGLAGRARPAAAGVRAGAGTGPVGTGAGATAAMGSSEPTPGGRAERDPFLDDADYESKDDGGEPSRHEGRSSRGGGPEGGKAIATPPIRALPPGLARQPPMGDAGMGKAGLAASVAAKGRGSTMADAGRRALRGW